MPGVTVEPSPALIEKVSSVARDGKGRYRIVDLRPGDCIVTSSLAGFSTVKRDGIELTGSFTATVNADLRVGALEETIRVTGQTPVVDVQSAKRQQVLRDEIIEAIPTARVVPESDGSHPGYQSAGTSDVGGIARTGQNLLLGARRAIQGSPIAAGWDLYRRPAAAAAATMSTWPLPGSGDQDLRQPGGI